ncbi:MAG TPA: hypothetical protein VGB77_10870 [Abditibacteriaceae bacterium]|jgi:hypothetical protein
MKTILFPALLLTGNMALAAQFSSQEQSRLMTYWNAPGRYQISAPSDAAQKGIWAARTSPEASQWFHKYNSATRGLKSSSATLPNLTTEQKAAWEKWVAAKFAHDEFLAQSAADAMNAQLRNSQEAPLPAPAAPLSPGPIPADLLAALGNPPVFSSPVALKSYTVNFAPNESFSYNDHVKLRARSPYFRFSQGVMKMGIALRDVPDAELDAIFTESGMTATEHHVSKAISRLEGGFESVNTYDTGFLSVGFIQFATLSGGAGSLGSVLKHQKQTRPQDFENDFRIYGVDVNDAGALVVLDPATGAELVGSEAVLKIIDDKRLTAVFQRAGTLSRAFRIAQIQVAKRQYYPADLPIDITIDGVNHKGKVSDVILSEAGLATLMDRKVNTGNIRVLDEVLTKLMTERKLTRLSDVIPFEREIIKAVQYRHDFLADKTLSQPPASPATSLAPVAPAPSSLTVP